MIYKFTSRASGDLIMMGALGDELLRLLGREPAAQGIIEAAAMPAAMRALQAALAAAAGADVKAASNDAPSEAPVALRQRLWPVMEMLRRCQAEGQPIVWGI